MEADKEVVVDCELGAMERMRRTRDGLEKMIDQRFWWKIHEAGS